MRVLVTGGAGFIGSHLVERLLNDNYEVISIDNFTLGIQDNVDKFLDNPNFKFFKININDTENFCDILKNEQIDFVYHIAANSDIRKSSKNPLIDYRDTFMTTFSVLELMRRKNIKNLFFSSSAAIYGDKHEKHLCEDLGSLLPISYYGGAKLASENFISAYAHMNDLNVVTFRFSNVIGPNLTHGVIYDFVRKLENNPNELEILGDGNQTKPYIYITDLIDCIMHVTKNMKPGVEIYNVGVDTTISVTKIADIVCEVLGYKNVRYMYTNDKVGWKGDVPMFKYDLTKIHSTGWKAKYTSDEAVKKTVEAIRGEL